MFDVNNGKHQVNLSFIDPAEGGPNSGVVSSGFPVYTANNDRTFNAQQMVYQITQHDCWTGALVMRFNTDLQLPSDFQPRNYL